MVISPFQIKQRQNTATNKAKIIRLYKAGRSYREIGRELGFSHTWVYLVVHESLGTFKK